MKMSLKSGLFLGLLVGFVSAILYAPKAGKEVRDELKDKINNIPYHFFNLLESIVDLTVSVLDFAKVAFHEQQDKLSRAVASGINAAKEKTQEMKKVAAINRASK